MTILTQLERHLGRFAITGLIRYVVAFTALVFLLIRLQWPAVEFLALDPQLILQGQVWRLFSWILIPTTTDFLWIFFYLFFTWWLGETLEATWGAFRLNLYYLLGMIGCTAAAFLFGMTFANFLLSFSLLLAVATVAPDTEILFFFFPLKIKWVAVISLVFPWGFSFVTGDFATRAAIIVCLLNYLIFFGPHLYRDSRDRNKATARRAKFEAAARDVPDALHRCETCGLTENADPEMDFRVSSDGREYCTRHLPVG